MSIVNMNIVATFTPNSSTLIQQVERFPDILKMCTEEKSGVTGITTKSLGKMKTSGNAPQVVRVQVNVPQTNGQPDVNRSKGSQVGLAITNITFLSCLSSKLTSMFGTSALMDISTSLDGAIEQNPPGLIVDSVTGPGALTLSTIMDVNGQFVSVITPTGNMSTGSVSTLSYSGTMKHTPSRRGDGFYNAQTILFDITDNGTLKKNFTLETTMTIDAVEQKAVADTGANLITVTNGGAEYPNIDESFAWTIPDQLYIQNSMVFDAGIILTQATIAPIASNQNGAYFKQGHINGTFTFPDPLSNPQGYGGKITFTNNTGAEIVAGTPIGKVWLNDIVTF